jgi:hypothetical protein
MNLSLNLSFLLILFFLNFSGVTELVTKMFTRAFNPAGAADTRDALSKALYGKAFDFLVGKINDCMSTPKGVKTKGIIGMLDIFGFEIFEINGFEQLCINFASKTFFNFIYIGLCLAHYLYVQMKSYSKCLINTPSL